MTDRGLSSRLPLVGLVLAAVVGVQAMRHRPAGRTGAADNLAPPAAAADPLQTYCENLLKTTREELTRADSKAQLLLAATGVAVGALLAGLLGGRWEPATLDNRIEWLWWAGGVAPTVAGIALLGAAVYPRRTGRPGPPSRVVTYFGHVVTHPDVTSLRSALASSSLDPTAHAIHQLSVVSRIVATKYRLIRFGMWSLATAGVSTTAATLVSATVLA
jgi:hypothetical protein